MVTDTQRFNMRELYEREGTSDRRFAYESLRGLILEIVIVKPATAELLRSELGKLDLKIQDSSTVKKVATRYPTELSGMKDGKLALCENDKENKFYEIITVIKKEER